MQFMHEYLLHDSERDALVRFRGPFIMPDWDGVQEGEIDYVVKSSSEALYKIAYKYYNDPLLKWVIAARNHMTLSDVNLHKGIILKVPSREWVERKLLPQAAALRLLDV